MLQHKGIGKIRAHHICETLGITPNTNMALLIKHNPTKYDQLLQLMANIKKLSVPTDSFHPIDISAIQLVNNHKLRLININSYRGRRLKSRLPARGQRTRSNARSARKLNYISSKNIH